ncbi:vacuolar transporter chaperone 1 [Dichotomocladium elegans]|nr:vacuolar transporter chaperone 1 [Dichotomocladium elegans]
MASSSTAIKPAWTAPQPSLEPNANNKRIALPVRVEPKVFFANERTFLSWLNFTVVLGGLAIGLLNFGDHISRVSAGLFTLTAMLIMLYALYTFQWRANKIRQHMAAPYDDRIGPTILCVLLVLTVAFNFYLRLGT